MGYYNYSIQLYNISVTNGTLNVTVPPPPPCVLTVLDTRHKVRHENESFMDLLRRHDLNWTNMEISANCSSYDIEGFENITFYQMWDEMRQPRDHVLNILKNITTVLKLVTVNCTHYDRERHANITISKVWEQLKKTREHILYVMDSLYFRLPNITVSCYDYPYNITVVPGITPEWWENPLIYVIGGNSILFIFLIVILVQVIKYCQKYCGTFIPGTEEIAKEEALYAKQAQIYLRKKKHQGQLKSLGIPDPNRPPQRKRKKFKRDPTEEEKRRDWILRHMDNLPPIILENPYAVS